MTAKQEAMLRRTTRAEILERIREILDEPQCYNDAYATVKVLSDVYQSLHVFGGEA